MKSPLEKIAERIREEKDLVEAKYSPIVRNHLLQLFRKAQKKDKKLESIRTINGAVFVNGTYLCNDGEYRELCLRVYPDQYEEYLPKKIDTKNLFDAAKTYSDYLCNGLPYIETIE